MLELRKYKNDSVPKFLKLPRFFPRRISDENERQFQNWIFLTEWSFSYTIFLALKEHSIHEMKF